MKSSDGILREFLISLNKSNAFLILFARQQKECLRGERKGILYRGRGETAAFFIGGYGDGVEGVDCASSEKGNGCFLVPFCFIC